MKKPKLVKDGTATYAVIGKSGERAGCVQQLSQRGAGWYVSLHCSPVEYFLKFATAKADALEKAERY